jgi:hypothetical protein
MKLLSLLRACTALLSIAALLPARALAATLDGAAPITIDHCTVAEQAVVRNPRSGFRMSPAGALTIVYTNDRDVAASDIAFRVSYQGRSRTFIDRGSFAPHTKISHEFNSWGAIYDGSSADCSLISAAFADGTRWDAVSQAQTPAPSR